MITKTRGIIEMRPTIRCAVFASCLTMLTSPDSGSGLVRARIVSRRRMMFYSVKKSQDYFRTYSYIPSWVYLHIHEIVSQQVGICPCEIKVGGSIPDGGSFFVCHSHFHLLAPCILHGFPLDFSHCENPAGFQGIRDNPVIPWILKIPFPSELIPWKCSRSRSRPVLLFFNPDPVQTSPVNFGQIPSNPCPVPCKPVKFDISQISAKPVPWFRDPGGFIP